MNIVTSSAYSGEVLDALLTKATTGNEVVEGGHIRLVPDVMKKFTLPRLGAGSMLQKRKEQPKSEDSKGDFTYSERYLEPKEMMVYTEFNPRIFESLWRQFQPKGNLVFSELPSNVQSSMLEEMGKVLRFELGNQYINGEYGDGEGEYFDGILTRISNAAEVKKITTPAAINESNILGALAKIRKEIPAELLANQNLKLFMSREDFEIYDAVLTAQPNKGTDYSKMSDKTYKGISIVVLASWPKDAIVAIVASMGLDSNVWGGVCLSDDADVVQIDKVTNAGEKYFFKMLMKVDTNIVYPEEVVLYDGRAVAPASEPTVE